MNELYKHKGNVQRKCWVRTTQECRELYGKILEATPHERAVERALAPSHKLYEKDGE